VVNNMAELDKAADNIARSIADGLRQCFRNMPRR
jgi:hypothetical protein